MICAVVFITIESDYKVILNHSKNQTCLSLSHQVQKSTKPKCDFTVLYGRDHLNAWSVVFGALLLIQGPLTASVWTKQNGTNAKEKFQVTKQTARHGASRLKSWWRQSCTEWPSGVHECLVEHEDIDINKQLKHGKNLLWMQYQSKRRVC